MTDWIEILFKAFWCGCAGLGFGVLFNAPSRALLPVWLCGFAAGFIKFSILSPAIGGGMILASFIASCFIGFAGIPLAHMRHVTPMIFTIPSVIPLIPGAFAYRTMLGLMQLTVKPYAGYEAILSKTVYNGTITMFVVLVLVFGVTIPMHIMRKESVKNMRIELPRLRRK